MGSPQDSDNTAMLEFQSLQLDVKTLQQNREEDKKEFLAFSNNAKTNFASIQQNFLNIQTNFERLFASRSSEEGEDSVKGNPHTPPNPVNQSVTQLKQLHLQDKPSSSAQLHDGHGKELNLDGTPTLGRLPILQQEKMQPKQWVLNSRETCSYIWRKICMMKVNKGVFNRETEHYFRIKTLEGMQQLLSQLKLIFLSLMEKMQIPRYKLWNNILMLQEHHWNKGQKLPQHT